MEYKIITTIEDFALLKDDWQRLENQSPDVTIFSTFDYCYTWWEVYQHLPEFKLWIIIVLHNNQIVGIAPLIIETRKIRFGFKVDIIQFLADGDYHDFLIERTLDVKADNVFKIIFSVFEEHNHYWDQIGISHIAHRSLLTNFIFKSNFNKSFNPLIENPYIDLTLHDNFEDFVKDKSPAKAKQYVNRLKKKADYIFEYNTIKINDCAIIHKLEKHHLNSKGLVHRHSIFENNYKSKFINTLESIGKVEIFSLKNKETGKIIIYNWGYIKDAIYYSVNTAYDPIYENLAVGRAMYYEMFQYAFKTKKFKKLDAGTGRYPWKFEWTSDFNLLYQLNVNKPRSKKLRIFYRLKAILKR